MRNSNLGRSLLLIAAVAIPCTAVGQMERPYTRAPSAVRQPQDQPTPSSRDREHRWVRPPHPRQFKLVPVITAITPNHAEPGHIVIIDGANFVGPYDQFGFNRVRFSGQAATHYPISRTRMWVSVPFMPEGDVMVTVESQNGTSNAVPFTVERNWWNFWSPKPGDEKHRR